MSKLTQRLVWGLALSVGLNLFVFGYLLAKDRQGPRRGAASAAEGGVRSGPPPMFLAPELLGTAQTAGVKGLQKRFRQELRQERRALRQARKGVRQALAADTFDKMALVDALGVLRARTQGTQQKLHETLVDFATTLTAEQRRRLARAQFNDRGGKKRLRRSGSSVGEERRDPAEGSASE